MDQSPTELTDQDEELVQAARQAREGDLRAFEELVKRYEKRILANCRYLTGDENNAEDLAQEVFVKAYFGLSRFEGRSSFRHWLKRIKVNHCLNHLKAQERAGANVALDEVAIEQLEQLHVGAGMEQDLSLLEEHRKIEAILNEMPKTLRVPLVMCDMDEFSYEDIAAALNIGLSAVKMRIKRGREHFKRLYAGSGQKAETQSQS